MPKYSHTQITVFEQCRHKYKLQYIDRIRVEGTTISRFLGSCVHECLEKLYLAVISSNIPEMGTVVAWYNDIWEQGWSGLIKIEVQGRSAEDYHLQGEKMVRDYYLRYHPFDQMDLLRVECKEALQLPDGNRYHIRIDRLEKKGDCYYVNDYKTGRAPNAEEEVDRQLAMYSLWVLRNYPAVQSVRQRWFYLADGKEVVVEYAVQDLLRAEMEVVRSISEIESCTSFPTDPGRLCDYCEYLELCPEFIIRNVGREEGAVSKAEALAAELIVEHVALESEKKRVEHRLATIKTMLINLSQGTGTKEFFSGDKKAAFKKEWKVKTPENIEELLRKAGLYDKYSQISHSRIAANVKKGKAEPQLREAVEMVEQIGVRISSRGGHSADGEEEHEQK